MTLQNGDDNLYTAELQSCVSRFRQMMSDKDNWQLRPGSNKSMVKMALYPSPDNTSYIVRGEGIITNCTRQQFLGMIDTYSVEKRKEFDPLIHSITHLKSLSHTRHCIRVAFNTPSFIVSRRDFIYVRENFVNGNETIVACISPKTQDDPELFAEVSGFVRGTLKTCVWHLIEQDDGSLYVCYMNHADYAGVLTLIPNFILNVALLDQPLVIERVGRLLGCPLVEMYEMLQSS